MKTSCIIFLLLGVSALPAQESDPATSSPELGGSVTLGGRFSENVQEFTADILQPLHQDENQILFLNMRGFAVENDAQEYNLGLIYRVMTEDERMILGVNTYYDGRFTEEDNYFSQFGAGVELLSTWVDLRGNVYLPVGDDRQTVSNFSTEDVDVERTSTRITTTTTTTRFQIYEEAQEGFDVEIGVLLPVFSEQFPTRVYAGYYDFDATLTPDSDGFRARLETRLHPSLSFDAEWYEDEDLNGTDYFVGFRLHVPFGERGTESNKLQRRLGQSVYRDFHIRTSLTPPQVVSTSSTQEVEEIEPPPPPPPPPPPEPEPEFVDPEEEGFNPDFPLTPLPDFDLPPRD